MQIDHVFICCAHGAPDASPFGLLLRPGCDGERPPFATWAYRPSHLPPGNAIEFADGVPLHEPELAWLPFMRSVQPHPDGGGDRAVPFRELVEIRVAVPDAAALSGAARAARDAAPLAYVSGAPLLELVFDCAREVVHDLRPVLSLVLRFR